MSASRSPAAADILHQNLDELAAVLRHLGPGVRADAPDAVHRARTTNRRIRSLLALGAPLIAADTAPVEAELARLGTALGEARDAEVRVELIADRLGRKKAAGLWKAARQEHRSTVRRLRKELDRGLLTDALSALRALPTEPTALGRRPAPEVLPGLARDALVVVRETAVGVAAAHDREDHEDRLHEVRKAARTVRYAAEAVTGRGAVDDVLAGELAVAARHLQDVLGDWRDLLLLVEWCTARRGARYHTPKRRMRSVLDDAAALEAAWPDALAALVVPVWSVSPDKGRAR
jgi:CHAD domain-containing protein